MRLKLSSNACRATKGKIAEVDLESDRQSSFLWKASPYFPLEFVDTAKVRTKLSPQGVMSLANKPDVLAEHIEFFIDARNIPFVVGHESPFLRVVPRWQA
jgi:hypothetical protein